MLHIQALCVGELDANCFLVSDDSKNAVIIDPGAEAPRILTQIQADALSPLAILLTHGHFDHFGAAAEIIRTLHIPLYVHPLDEPMLLSATNSLAESLGLAGSYHKPDQTMFRHFEEGEILKFSEELTFQVLHTPGHSPGSCCFKHDDILFSGDTLFRDGVGRVDFAGGNIRDMRASLKRLGEIEGDCTVYCGHYGNTTLEHERTFGHYLTAHR